jgi:hypothetical protein
MDRSLLKIAIFAGVFCLLLDCLLVCLILVKIGGVERLGENQVRLKATGQPPVLGLSKHGLKWHVFLSHKWPSGQEPCAS